MNRAMELQTSNNGGENLDSDVKTELQEPINGGPHGAYEPQSVFEDVDSACSTPYVSAPSSPGRGPVGGFYYSAPASPMHFAITKSSSSSAQLPSSSLKDSHSFSFEFEFSGRFGSHGSGSIGSMSSADELFLNGKIRPMKLSTHLEQPQVLAPLLDLEGEDEEDDGGEIVGFVRGRDLRLRDKSLRRRTRSMSPLRNTPVEWTENDDGDLNTEGFLENDSEEGKTMEKNEEGFMSSETTTPSVSGSSSRSSSAGRNSKRWVFLKDFLYRSKSEGRSSNHKFWSNISFSSAKEKKPTTNQTASTSTSVSTSISSSTKQKAMKPSAQKVKGGSGQVPAKKPAAGKPTNGVGKRRIPPSPHELHYTKNRAQAEELRKKTFLPYRQGLLGCLGFSSKGYGAVNGFARALNSVSSR